MSYSQSLREVQVIGTMPTATILAKVKTRLKLLGANDFDAELTDLITQAFTAIESFLSKGLLERKFELSVKQVQDGSIFLPYPPILEVEAVKDLDGTTLTFTTLPKNETLISNQIWVESENGAIVEYRSGYTSIPLPIIVAVAEYVCVLFEVAPKDRMPHLEAIKKGISNYRNVII